MADTAPPEADSEKHHPLRPTLLLLVRHAVTEQTGPILSGRTPGIDLSDKGREQAARVAQRLAVLPVDAVFASPIERTLETARAEHVAASSFQR